MCWYCKSMLVRIIGTAEEIYALNCFLNTDRYRLALDGDF